MRSSIVSLVREEPELTAMVCVCVCEQEQVSGGTTSTVLRNLLPDTSYKVTVVPVYPEGEGLRQSDEGQTRKSTPTPSHASSSRPGENQALLRMDESLGKVKHFSRKL